MKVFNTLSRSKEEFIPMEPGKVKMYACGPTVYNFIHIGNARPLCVFDVLRRYLEYRGYGVTFVQNFTDIDDKIINKANEEGTGYRTVSERYIAEYKVDAAGLGVREATIHPKATETMEMIIETVKEIVENGYDLSINKYKKTEYVPVEYPPTSEIFAQLRELEAEIQKGLEELEGMV